METSGAKSEGQVGQSPELSEVLKHYISARKEMGVLPAIDEVLRPGVKDLTLVEGDPRADLIKKASLLSQIVTEARKTVKPEDPNKDAIFDGLRERAVLFGSAVERYDQAVAQANKSQIGGGKEIPLPPTPTQLNAARSTQRRIYTITGKPQRRV